MQFSTGIEWIEHIRGGDDSGLMAKEMDEFAILTDVDMNRLAQLRATIRNAIVRVRGMFPYLSFDPPYKQWPVLLFESQDLVLEYYALLLGEGQESMIPGGVWISSDPGHFLMPLSSFDSLDAALSHELIHAALDRFPTPRWFEEGLACNVEMAMGNRLHPFHDHNEYTRLKDFFRSSDPFDFLCNNQFSDPIKSEYLYNLSHLLVGNLLKLPDKLENLVQAIHDSDQGVEAISKVYGWSLENMARDVLQPTIKGSWITRLVYGIFGYR